MDAERGRTESFEGQPLRCSKCGREIAPGREVWLDLHADTLALRREPWPADVSQGLFPFGSDCARGARVWGIGGRWVDE